MGAVTITWTPRGTAQSLRTLEFPAPERALTLFRGGLRTDAAISVSRAGQAVGVVHDAYSEYRVEYRAITPWGNAEARKLFDELGGWWEHAAAGGEFSFALDGNRAASTTLSSGASQGASSLSVASESGFYVDDWIFLEDADDITKTERKQVETVATGSLALHFPTLREFASGSVVRSFDYFPKCVIAYPSRPPLLERPAGEGPFFDLDFEFRTVR